MVGTTDDYAWANQPGPLTGANLFSSDPALMAAVEREGTAGDIGDLAAHGGGMGSAATLELGRLANAFPPVLRTHDRRGRRCDVVEYHPAYHELMAMGTAAGLHFGAGADGGGQVRRAAKLYMTAQAEPGHCCPLTMTNASAAVLADAGGLGQPWLEKIRVPDYDPAVLPAMEKRALTLGMGMTERQGGSDVRTNLTEAREIAGAAGLYTLKGHKWFLSAPMSDAFLMLAQAPGGLSCFLVPRILDDGARNGLRLVRLKDKLGNRSNASSECEIDGAQAWLVGVEGRGVAMIIQMVMATRLDCAVSSAGLMRRAVAMAIHHCRQRTAFARTLASQPLMAHVLADLVLDVEAAVALSFRLARSFDLADDPRAAAWRRLMTAVTKYWVCKIAPVAIGEAMECLGGNGYVEEHGVALLYREAPVNGIWEGSGNIMALDVLRVMEREPGALEVVLEDIAAAAGGDALLAASLQRVRAFLHEPRTIELRARAFVEALAVTAAGALLRAHAPDCIADAFIAARLSGEPGRTYGQGLERVDRAAILARALAG